MADLSKNPVKKSPIKVIFWKIEESYLINTDVTVHYSVSGDMEKSSRDWIGLYRVGWRSHLDYIYYEWSSTDNNSDSKVECKVVFPAKKLPKDDEFYQFCYVTSSGQVQGASTPFQFKSIIVDDFIEDEDDSNGIVVVKTKTTFLEDSLEKANNTTSKLIKKIEMLEGEIEMLVIAEKDLSKKLHEAKEEKERLRSLLEETSELFTDQKQANNHLQDCIKGFQEKIEVLEQEKHSMENRLDDSDLYVASLQEKIKLLVTEKDSLNGHVRVIEEQLKTMFQEQDILRNKLTEEESKSTTYRKELERNAQDLSLARKACVDQAKMASDYKNQKETVMEMLGNTEGMLKAAELCKVMLNDEVLSIRASQEESHSNCKVLQQEVCHLNANIDDLKALHAMETKVLIEKEQEQNSLINSMAMGVAQLEEKCGKLEKELEDLKTQKENEPSGHLYAMKVSHDTLVERYANLSKKFESQQKMYCILKAEKKELELENSELKNDNDNMRERIIMCQRAYKDKSDECDFLRSRNGDEQGFFNNGCEGAGDQSEKLRKYKKMLWENSGKNEQLTKLLEEKEKEIDHLRLILSMSEPEMIGGEECMSNSKDPVEEYLECLKHVEGLTLCQHCHVSIDGCDEDVVRSHLDEHQREGSANAGQ